MLTDVLLLLLGMCCSTFAACAESAYINVSMGRILKFEAAGDKRWKKIKSLKESSDQVYATVLVINTFGNLMVSSFSAKILVSLLGLSQDNPAHAVFMTLAVAAFAFLLMELIPKMYGTYHFESTLLRVTPWLGRLVSLLRIPLMPIIALPRKLGGQGAGHVLHGTSMVSEEDLIEMMELGRREGSFKEHDVKVLRNIFESSEVEAEDIMVPRINMRTVAGGDELDKALLAFRESGVSRLVVYEDTIDNVVGVLIAKDLLRHRHLDGAKPVRHYMRKGVYLIPETKKVLDLLAEFRNRNLQLALVVDEYGGTMGLLTLEDVMEEIVGEIFDEHDVVKPQSHKLPSGEIRYQAGFPLEKFAESCSLVTDGDLEDYETLGGWLSGRIGHVPSPGEEWREGSYRFVVESVMKQRIQRLLVLKEK